MAHFLDSKIKPFDAPGSARDGSDLEFRAHVVGYRKDDFSVTLSGHGFEAHRYLTPSDLRELRDWIDAALNERGRS